MKSGIINLKNKTGWILSFAVVLTVASCKKDNGYLGFTPGTGAPTITSVHTYYKTDTTVTYDTIINYNAAGQPVQTLQQNPPAIVAFDSVVTAANLGNTYRIIGTNLGSTTFVTFNGYNAYFNRALITDNSIIVQVPSKTPYLGAAANDSLVITTEHGKVGYKLVILPPAPTVASYSNYDFTAGSQITLNGVGFASVTSITVNGTQGGTGDVSIVSQNDTVMVVQFASMNVSRGNLNFLYSAGGQTDSAKGTQELVDLDNAYPVFAGGNIAPGWGSWSWDNAVISNAHAITATSSWNAQYSGGGYKVDGFRNGGGNATDGLAYSPAYTYLVFWVYGGTAKETLYILWGNEGFNNQGPNQINAQTVLPNQWNYFKIPISSLLWNTGTTNWAANSSDNVNTVAFLMTSNSVTEQLYFDDVVLVK
jgi:hypothetical protein